jgi:hypothetical protein
VADLILTITPTAADHRKSVRLSGRRSIWRTRAAGVLTVLFALPALAAGEPAPWLTGFVFTVVGLAFVVGSFTMPSALVRRLPASAYKPRTCEIGADGLRLSTDVFSRQWSWRAFRSATRTNDLWLLRGEPGDMPVALQRRVFTPEQESRFAEILTAHGLLPGTPAGAPQPVPPEPRP